MAGWQLLDARDDAIVVGHVTEGEKILNRGQIRFLPQQRVAEQPFEFRCERHRAIGETDIVKRLHPQPIAREEQAAARMRSEEHTSELQSLMRISYAVFCLKKKNKTITSKSSIIRHTINN